MARGLVHLAVPAEPFRLGRDGGSVNWDEEDIAARLMAAISSLPPEAQEDAVQAVLSGVIKQMPEDALETVRTEIAGMFPDEDLHIVRTTLDMIDGQLALREIAGAAEWR